MRVFSKGRLARAIAHLLTLTFVCFAWLTDVGTGPAAAQIVTRAATTQTVAVVPFENLSGIRPDVLGEDASTAVEVELVERLLLDVLPKADVTLQMRSLGLTAPLSDVELVRLAAELEVALLITGQVRAARLMRTPEGRSADVVLAVRLFDRVARADVNGALVSAQSPASPDASDEVLLGKALAQAAFEAVEEMKSRPTITAMVLWSRGDTIFLNVGSRGGVRPGMQMVAIRGGERISRVKVTDADATGAYAEVVGGATLRTGDHLRAVYELPKEARGQPAKVIEKAGKRFENVVLAAALLFGLGGHASRSRLLEEGDIAFPSLVASNLANGAESGYVSYPPTGTGMVLLTWERYSNTQAARLLAYEIYRNEQLIGAVVQDVYREPIYIDRDRGQGRIAVSVTIDPVNGAITDYSEVGFSTADLGITATDDSVTWVYDDQAPQANVLWQYRIQPVLLTQYQVDAGIYEYRIARDTELSTPRGVMPVETPYAFPLWWTFQGYVNNVYEVWDVTANPFVAGNLATFSFYSPLGADELVVQVTRDPNVDFSPAGVHSVTEPWDPLGVSVPPSVQVDLSQVPGTGDVFWWRVGGRTRRNPVAPRPFPLDVTNDYGYVWSPRLTFSLSTVSRAALLHQERETVARSEMRAVRTDPRTTPSRIHRAE